MAGRKALISKDDLDRMATAVAAHGVVLKGRVDPLGGFTFTMTRQPDAVASSNDDLDDRIDEFGAL
ncbi:hypothetical protein [Qipengyuania spongiae]|uniref:Uncharacterized protein n=1 Tax=Qipengyuania spongiae TaxID=2909673 RepID=A0ABY5SYM1_9SPHN|nr:hypothetical protein [Qipengyuania spongiae]UVI39344.1 hypothetical protein L1F33_14125 [Qipengyuania spongiae]